MLTNSNTKINGTAGEMHQLLRALTAPLPEVASTQGGCSQPLLTSSYCCDPSVPQVVSDPNQKSIFIATS